MMKFLVLFGPMLVCIDAYGVPYNNANWPPVVNEIIPYRTYDVPRHPSLTGGLGAVAQPVLQNILHGQPNYGNHNIDIARLVELALASRNAVENNYRTGNRVNRIDDDEDRRSGIKRRSEGVRRSADDDDVDDDDKKVDGSGEKRRSSIKERNSKEKRDRKERGSGEKRDDEEERGGEEEDERSGERERGNKDGGDDESGENRDSSGGENSLELANKQDTHIGNVAPVCILFGNYAGT